MADNYQLTFVDGELLIKNTIPLSIFSSFTSPQHQMNGTQSQVGQDDGVDTRRIQLSMGPNTGSGVFQGTYMDGLILDKTGYLTKDSE